MKSTFKRVVRNYEFPKIDQWLKDGRTKEEHAEEIERLTALRKKDVRVVMCCGQN